MVLWWASSNKDVHPKIIKIDDNSETIDRSQKKLTLLDEKRRDKQLLVLKVFSPANRFWVINDLDDLRMHYINLLM